MHLVDYLQCCTKKNYAKSHKHQVHNIIVIIQGEMLPLETKQSGGKLLPHSVCGACGGGEGRGVHRVLVGKPEGKRPLGRLRRRWEDNIKINLQEVGGVVLDGFGSE